MSSENKNIITGLLLITLVLGGIVLLGRRRGEERPATMSRRIGSEVKYFPVVQQSVASTRGRRYQNTETWDIEWNEDGLPQKIVIKRDAVQT